MSAQILSPESAAAALKSVGPWALSLPPPPPSKHRDPVEELLLVTGKLGLPNIPGYRVEGPLHTGNFSGYGALALPDTLEGRPIILRTAIYEAANADALKRRCAAALADELPRTWGVLPFSSGENLYPCRIVGDGFIEALVELGIAGSFGTLKWEVYGHQNSMQSFLHLGQKGMQISRPISLDSSRPDDMLVFNQLYGPLNDAAQDLLFMLGSGRGHPRAENAPLRALASGQLFIHRRHDGLPDYLHTVLALKDYGFQVKEKLTSNGEELVSERSVSTREEILLFHAHSAAKNRLEASLLSARRLVESIPWLQESPIPGCHAKTPELFLRIHRPPEPNHWWPATYDYRPGYEFPISVTQIGRVRNSYLSLASSTSSVDSPPHQIRPIGGRLRYATLPRPPAIDRPVQTPPTTLVLSDTPRTLPISASLQHLDTVTIGSLPPVIARFVRAFREARREAVKKSFKEGDRRDIARLEAMEIIAIVGGGVCDAILGRNPHDIDVNGVLDVPAFVCLNDGYANRTSPLPSPDLPLQLLSEATPDLAQRNTTLREGLSFIRGILTPAEVGARYLFGRFEMDGLNYDVEQAGFDIITSRGEILRRVPTLSVCAMGITNNLRFLDPWKTGRKDLEEGRARIVGNLEQLSLRTLIGLVRRQTERRLVFDDPSLLVIENAMQRLDATIAQIAEFGLRVSPALVLKQLHKEVEKFNLRVGETVVVERLSALGIKKRLDAVKRLLAF